MMASLEGGGGLDKELILRTLCTSTSDFYTSRTVSERAKIDMRSGAGPDDLSCTLCFMSIACARRVVSVK